MLASAFAVTAFAGTADGPKKYFTSYGKSYYNYARIAINSTTCTAVTFVVAASSVPSGYMGAQAKLYEYGTNILRSSTNVIFNSTAQTSHAALSTSTGTTGKSYYSHGYTHTYNPNVSGYYDIYTTDRSPSQTC